MGSDGLLELKVRRRRAIKPATSPRCRAAEVRRRRRECPDECSSTKGCSPGIPGPRRVNVNTLNAKTPLTCGNTLPEVGLELHSSPCNSGHPRKHAESCPVRPHYDRVRRLKFGHCPHPEIRHLRTFQPPTSTFQRHRPHPPGHRQPPHRRHGFQPRNNEHLPSSSRQYPDSPSGCVLYVGFLQLEPIYSFLDAGKGSRREVCSGAAGRADRESENVQCGFDGRNKRC